MPPKLIQNAVRRLWPVALLIAFVVFPLEVWHVYKKQKENL